MLAHPFVLLTMHTLLVSSSGMSFPPNRQVIFKQSLRVGLKNEKAYRLYERLGFHHVNQTETHNHMVCELDPE